MHIKNLQLPAYTQKILQALNVAGYEAYLVGGAVRDLLLGAEPSDFDITTSARPQEVVQLCRQLGWRTVDKLGQNFGCVVIVLDNIPTEVTTFRGERYDESDSHRPVDTWFCNTLREDLSRRDFTVNAMALDASGNLYDYFGGYDDLRKKILRTVGDSRQRYNEDALRMLRACRFVAQLGFAYVQDGGAKQACGMQGTPYYLPQTYQFPTERCARLSLERVRKELEKTLLGEHAGQGLMLMLATGIFSASCRVRRDGQDSAVPILPEAMHLLGLAQNPRFHLYDTWEHTLLAIDNSPRKLIVRWALLLHDLGKGMPEIRRLNKESQPTDPGHEALSASMAHDILTRLCYPQSFVSLAVWLVAQHMRFAPLLHTKERTLLRWVRAEAASGAFKSQQELTQGYELLAEVFLADMGATHARENSSFMQEGRELAQQVIELARTRMPVTTKDLHISGSDLLQLLPQEEIKNTLCWLLTRVQNGNLPNERAALLDAVRKNIRRRKNSTEEKEQ